MSYERPLRTVEREGETIDVTPEPPFAKSDLAPAADPVQPASIPKRKPGLLPRRRWFRIPKPPLFLTTFIMFVIIPSIASQIYLAFLASDQYVATARFAVKSAQEEGTGLSDMMASGLGTLNLAGQDAHVIVAYIHSRAIIDDLQRSIDVRAIFSRPEADFIARLKKNATIEELTDYWTSMVTTSIDGPSGIVTLTVRAFRRQDALDLNKAVLDASERLVNDVSLRARRDAMSRAESEVRRSEGMVQQALADMRQFRDQAGFIDPTATATMMAKLITDTVAEKIQLENDLFVSSRAMSPNAPTLTALNLRLQAVNEQLDKLKASMTSNSRADSPLSNALVRFEELEMNRIFAEKLYTIAQDALERARVRAERQNIYMIVFVPPMLPEEARFPERISLSIIIPITLLVLWGIGAMLAAIIEDHRN